ncbi:MAG: MGMT family protein [Candidatus Brennerbacteria bacterium]
MHTTPSFTERVHTLTTKIPRGRVVTYQKLAQLLHNPRAVRAVGNALNKSPGMPRVPCHRVVRSDGSVGGFAGGTNTKIKLLRKEGVVVERGKVDLKRFGK